MKRTRLVVAAAACTIAATPHRAWPRVGTRRTDGVGCGSGRNGRRRAGGPDLSHWHSAWARASGWWSALVSKDANGTTHVRYARTFAGCGSSVGTSSHTPRRRAAATSRGTSGKVAVASTVAKVAPAAALAKSGGSAAELVVFVTASGPRLAYDAVRSGIGADQTPSRLHTIVDAASGATLASWDDIQTGTGKGIFVGTVSIGTSGSAGAYTMRDRSATTRRT